MKEGIQLDLFAGILFTPEQEQKIAEFVKKREELAISAERINNQNELLLIGNGFVKGVDFVNTFKVEIVTRETHLGFSYNNTDFKAEVTFKNTTGCIALKGKRFNSYSKPNELSDATFSIDFQGGNVNCYSIQENSRFIKPKTLFDKLMVFNRRQEQLFQEYLKKTDLKQTIVEKYTKLYPNATVTTSSDYSRYSGTFDIVEVKFESSSYIQFRLDTYNNKEFIHKKYDAEFEKMSSEELLERFSKQVKKEGSN